MRGCNLQKVENLLPPEPPKTRQGQVGQIQREIAALRFENANLRPLKSELARLRASLADGFYAASEKAGPKNEKRVH